MLNYSVAELRVHIILEAVYSENYSKFAMEFEYKCFSVR